MGLSDCRVEAAIAVSDLEAMVDVTLALVDSAVA